jgi:hypothetical protein
MSNGIQMMVSSIGDYDLRNLEEGKTRINILHSLKTCPHEFAQDEFEANVRKIINPKKPHRFFKHNNEKKDYASLAKNKELDDVTTCLSGFRT